MTIINKSKAAFRRRLLAVGIVFTAVALSAQEDANEEVYNLSPFTISSDEDNGYVANSTLAGTRIKTNLADVGASTRYFYLAR